MRSVDSEIRWLFHTDVICCQLIGASIHGRIGYFIPKTKQKTKELFYFCMRQTKMAVTIQVLLSLLNLCAHQSVT